MKINASKIILASGSPRRAEMLKNLGLEFEVIVPKVEEQAHTGELASDYVKRNSKLKLDNVYNRIKDSLSTDSSCLIIACDTVVSLDGKYTILEKPKDKEDAFSMLSSLSGITHIVISGVSLLYKDNSNNIKTSTFSVETKVKIKKLTEEEILWYIDTKEPMDKAGSYAMQGIGSYFIERIEGSHTNVIGLPLCELYTHITELY